ncbi:MAG: hypothetical protein ACPGED_06020 [Flavobacteriales bacterium]
MILLLIPFLWGVQLKGVQGIEADNLQRVYVWNSNKLVLYERDGTELFSYSESAFGDIDWVDVRDPMKPMVFFKDAGKAVLLDNTLSAQGDEIDLFNIYPGLGTLLASSIDHHYWVFDGERQELVRLDASFGIVTRSGNLNALGVEGMSPERIQEHNGKVFLWEKDYGFVVFDIFGTIVRKIPINGLKNYHVNSFGFTVTPEEGDVLKYNWLDYRFDPVDRSSDFSVEDLILLGRSKVTLNNDEVKVIR